MSNEQAKALEACLALLEKATAGEWVATRFGGIQRTNADGKLGSLIASTGGNSGMWDDFEENTQAIVAAVNLLKDHGPALLAALRLREGWIPVSERLPERWEHVDVWPDPRDDTYNFYAPADGGTNGVKAGRWYYNDRDGYDTEIRVTHWRPLPSPPEGAP